MNKFYDIEPDGANESHYLCENGKRILRFNELEKAEIVRGHFMNAEAVRMQRSIDELYQGQPLGSSGAHFQEWYDGNPLRAEDYLAAGGPSSAAEFEPPQRDMIER